MLCIVFDSEICVNMVFGSSAASERGQNDAVWVVMSRGNPRVQQVIPLPLPLKTLTPGEG